MKKSWVVTSIGDLRKEHKNQGIDPAKFPQKKFILYSIPGFDAGSPEILKGNEIGSNKIKVSPGSILLSKLNPRISRVWEVAEHNEGDIIASTEWIEIQKSERFIPKFIKYFLSQEWVRQHLASNVSGVGGSLTRTNSKHVEALEIPEPTREEQEAVVKQIESLFSEIDKGTQELESAKQKLELYRQSVLNATCCGDEITLEKILTDERGIFDGPFGSNLKSSDYTTSGVRVIRLENIGELRFKDEATYISKKKYESIKKHTVFAGDIVFSSFVAESVRACFIPNNIEFAVNKADCFCLRPNKNLIDPRFLLYQISSPRFYQNLLSEVKGVTRPRVNTKILRTMPLRLPSLERQQEIIDFINDSFSASEIVEREIAASEEKIIQLKHTILKKTFEGEF